ncbi:hypothetical protein [Streptomyces sp. NPDC057496]|uniref:hypothetical protein n=1 Tax=Streptomyces sp. NPDC057496 TaxID=3346149 RepID=UPI0036CD37A5
MSIRTVVNDRAGARNPAGAGNPAAAGARTGERSRTASSDSAPYRSRTRRLLERHRAALVLVALVSMAALLLSYRQVQSAAGEMRTRGAPAVQGVAATQLALLRAHEEARGSVADHIADVVGAGARYETQLAAADQGLTRLADVQIDGERGRGALETVNGVLTSYSASITPAVTKYVSDDPMREEKFAEADTLLTRKDTGVVPRLDVLQGHQMERVDLLSSAGTFQRAGWVVAGTGLLAMALLTLSALWLLRTRCGHSLDLCLLVSLAATVFLAVVPLTATVVTLDRLDTARDGLARIERRTHHHTEPDRSQRADTGESARVRADLARSQQAVTGESARVRAGLAARDWQSGTYYGALAGGVTILLLPVIGLGRHLNTDYRRPG